MTFKKFEELFKTKYPEAMLFAHGKVAGTEKNGKVTVAFTPEGKAYEYYGAYEDILNRIGIQVISKARLEEVEAILRQYKEWHGQPNVLLGGTSDYSNEIAHYEKKIADIKESYIIV